MEKIKLYLDAYIILPYVLWKRLISKSINDKVEFYLQECNPCYKIENRLLELSDKIFKL